MKNFFKTHLKTSLFGILACLFLLAGCSEKYDDSELWEKISAHEQRLATLEAWSATVNTNITALQNLVNTFEEGNYITGVTSLVENSVETGYVITFHTGTPITIRHGQKGDEGHTPVISVKQHTDEKLYWTLNGEWLLDEADRMIPLTGADGLDGTDGEDGQNGTDAVAPRIRINTGTNEWEISTDNGTTWTSTGVKATGEKGEKGDDGEKGDTGEKGDDGEKGDTGDAVFAENGIDSSHADYVVFTLVGGETITLPKYKSLSISFTQPKNFFPNQTRIVTYSLTGSITLLKVIDIPAGWTVLVNKEDCTFNITAPEELPAPDQREAEALVLLSDGADGTLLRTLQLSAQPQMTITTENNDVNIAIKGNSGTVTVDWGDGATQNYELWDSTQISHNYATTTSHTIHITGDITNITYLNCSGNEVTSLDVSNNTALSYLNCSNNQLTSLDVNSNTALTFLYCYENQLTAAALNTLFGTLHNNTTGKIYIRDNPGTGTCNQSIATAKGWTVNTTSTVN